jgi:tRNA 2-thiouridine synthesizing protein A
VLSCWTWGSWETAVKANTRNHTDQEPVDEWDAGWTGCGELLMLLSPRIRSLEAGQILRVIARDAGAPEDLPAWCRLTGHELVYIKHPEYWIKK